ncbi:ATP-binding cassette domain-containing protein, partial [Peribacillus simplex]
ETPNAGSIRIGNKELDFARKVSKKDIVNLRTQTGMVFQHHNLFPHLTAIQNVMEGLVTVKKMGKEEAKKKANYFLEK